MAVTDYQSPHLAIGSMGIFLFDPCSHVCVLIFSHIFQKQMIWILWDILYNYKLQMVIQSNVHYCFVYIWVNSGYDKSVLILEAVWLSQLIEAYIRIYSARSSPSHYINHCWLPTRTIGES